MRPRILYSAAMVLSTLTTFNCGHGINLTTQQGPTSDRSRSIDQHARIFGGDTHSCLLSAGGNMCCWGVFPELEEIWGYSLAGEAWALPIAVASRRVSTLSFGQSHYCYLSGGQLYCGGSNQLAQLGSPVGRSREGFHPTTLLGPGPFTAVRSGLYFYTCALGSSGDVFCWGTLIPPRIDIHPGTLFWTESSHSRRIVSPSRVRGIVDAVDVSVGSTHACALNRSGDVYCWGSNNRGQLGPNFVDHPSPVPGATPALEDRNSEWRRGALRDSPIPLPLHNVRSVSAGDGVTCAITSSGDLHCWGDSRLFPGDGFNTFAFSGSRATTSFPVRDVGLGAHSSCVVYLSSTMKCRMGLNGSMFRPWNFSADSIESFTIGSEHVCFVRSDGTSACAGDNRYGQLGNSRALRFSVAAVEMTVCAADRALQVSSTQTSRR